MRVFHHITAIVLVLSLGACAAGSAAPAPSATTQAIVAATPAPAAPATSATRPTAAPIAAPAGNADQRQAIQATLDMIAQAYMANDKALLNRALDQHNRAFVRLVENRFDEEAPGYKARNVQLAFTIASIRQREHGFVQVQVNYPSGTVADWLFRNIDGQWQLSEPTAAQLGKPHIVETAHFIFSAYDWSNDINDQVIKMMEQAATRVHAQLPKHDDQKATVVLRSVFDIMALTGPSWAIGYYQYGPRNRPARIMVTMPGSFAFGSYNPDEGWQPELDQILAHEYTHLVNDRSYTPIVRMSTWMSEGLAEYISGGSGNIRTVARALAKQTLIPIDDRTADRPLHPHDLQHMTDPYSGNDIGLAYGEAHALVKFIVETYGGLDGFWRFIESYDQTQSLDKALKTGFDTDYTTFDQHWRQWIADGGTQ